MKRITKLDWFFGLSTAWDILWAVVNLVQGDWGWVIFFAVFAVIQMIGWAVTRKNILERTGDERI